MKNAILMCLLFVSLASLSACNTVEGAGKDLENAGRSIQNTF